MVDTVRTKSALQSILADNTAGNISPQDLRDMLVSIMGVYGSIVIESSAVSQAISSGVAEQLTEWTANGIANDVTPEYVSDQITIDNDGDYEVSFQNSFEGITNCVFQFTLYKNGSPLAVGCQRKTATADIGSASFTCQVTLADTDTLSVWVEGDQNGSFTSVDAQLTVKRIG